MKALRWLFLLWVLASAFSVLWVSQWRPLEVAGADARSAAQGWTTLTGAVHVHTLASDGGGTVHEVARAAAKAGLDFVVITDHNTLHAADQEGDHGGVLVLAGVECSRSDGHVLFLGSSGLRDSDIGGGGRRFFDVLSTSRVPFVAHPTNERRPWDGNVWPAGGGMELISFNTAWRERSPIELAAAILALPFRRRAAFASIVREPADELAMLDTLETVPPLIGSVDAHSCLPLPGDHVLRFPRYEDLFSVLVTRVYLRQPVPFDAEQRIERVRQALERGRSEIVLPAFGPVPPLRFAVHTTEGEIEVAGARLPASRVALLEVELSASGVPTDLTLLHDNQVSAHFGPGTPGRVRIVGPEPGHWRVEVRQVRDAERFWGPTVVPWIFSNAITLTSVQAP